MKKFLPLLAAMLSTLDASAQSPSPAPSAAAPVPPAGSLLNRAPDFARWTIEYRPLATPPTATDPGTMPSPAGSPARETHRNRKGPDADETGRTLPAHPPASTGAAVVRTIVIKTGSIFHLQTLGASGDAEEQWCLPNLEVTLRPHAAEPLVSVPGNPPDETSADFSKSDFPNCAWISRENYAGLERYDDHGCLVFKGRVPSPTDDQTRAQDGPRGMPVTAYVDYYSRLPVALISGDGVQTYHYEFPPDQLQTIPDRVADAMKRHEQKIKDLSLKPAKPF